MLTGKSPRVPKRQFEDILGNEERIYQFHAGPGLNKKPYTTDESQVLEAEWKKDEETNARLKAQQENL